MCNGVLLKTVDHNKLEVSVLMTAFESLGDSCIQLRTEKSIIRRHTFDISQWEKKALTVPSSSGTVFGRS